jgi:hypothetical protein
MSYEDLPTSTRIAVAQNRRERHRRGVLRAKIIAGAFGAAVLFGFVAGCNAPGA